VPGDGSAGSGNGSTPNGSTGSTPSSGSGTGTDTGTGTGGSGSTGGSGTGTGTGSGTSTGSPEGGSGGSASGSGGVTDTGTGTGTGTSTGTGSSGSSSGGASMQPAPSAAAFTPEDFADYEPVPAVPADTTPPVLTVVPPTTMTVPLRSMFQDPGFYAIDESAGRGLTLASFGLAALRTALNATSTAALGQPAGGARAGQQIYGPWTLVYRATDGAGNQAEPGLRRVYIDVSCSGVGEYRCSGTADCSQSGLCLPTLPGSRGSGSDSSGTSGGANVAVQPFVPPVDTHAPVVTPIARASDQLASDGAGLAVVDTYVTVGAVYKDAGAIAFDNIDGNISAHVSSSGLKAVCADALTADAEPYIIRYQVADAAGNVGEAMRRVFVRCAAQERVCAPAGDSTAASCSGEGVCGGALPPAPAPVAPPPSLHLIGPATVYATAGDVYAKCLQPRPLAVVCDLVRFTLLHMHQPASLT
jgi:hypothetical protein